MQPIYFRGTQKLSKTERFFERLKETVKMGDLDKYGKMGVEALKEYTPKDTGKTADSWEYGIEHDKNGSTIYWYNTNNVNGVNIALILQYGHLKSSGYWVQGVDYINPAMKPVFDEIAKKAWREVERA
jgi:hypothetical protein